MKYCCAAHLENAEKKAEKYGICPATFEEILRDGEVELVIVLTPVPAHYALIRRALEAGKHVYTEKTITDDPVTAEELASLAAAKGLRLGSAPDTFLGPAIQTAKKLLQCGGLGEVSGFDVYANRDLDRMTNLYPFLRLPGGGICYDYGVYHITALVELLGQVREVYAIVENRKPLRIGTVEGSADFGKAYAYENEAQVTAILRMESGVAGTLTLNGESIAQDLRHFRIYGQKGVLEIPDPNGFGGDLTVIRTRAEWEGVPAEAEDLRGLGAQEMLCAMAEDRPHRANADRAVHVLKVIDAIMESGRSGLPVKL